MVKKIKRVAVWIATIIALIIAWKAFDEYQFVKAHQRAMDLMLVPWDVIDRAYKK